MTALEIEPELSDARPVRTLVVLGDSIGVGVGDPVPGGWRGFPVLLAQAVGPTRLVNLCDNGARIGCVRTKQLPRALAANPDAAVVLVGMNDTMRSDFHTGRLRADLDRTVAALTAAGALVITCKYHDHGRVFYLPGVLRRALTRRVANLNAVIEDVAIRHRALIVDLGELPNVYAAETWSVDRLHPSELGHRKLARAIANSLATAGAAVPGEVSLVSAGGRPVRSWEHLLWLVIKGIPWLWRRGHDLVPYVLTTFVTALFHPTNRAEPHAISATLSDLSDPATHSLRRV